MKKVLAVMVISFLAVTSAYAQATGWAAGYDQNIGGISLRYMPSSGLGFEGVLGLVVTSPENDALDTGVDLNLGLNLVWPWFSADRVRLNGLGGVWIFMTQPTAPGADSSTDLQFVFGVEPEVFVFGNFSVSTKMGVQLLLNDEPGEAGSTVFGTFGPNFNLLNGLSVRYYFR
ncbi:MAG: hypothetical protein ACYC9O_01520 [Candidatus Latescibacterota bacterium]